MGTQPTLVQRIAQWATDVTVGDVPAPVLDLGRTQRRSVLGASAASCSNGAARRVLAAVTGWAHDGPAPLLGQGRTVDVESALYAATALSIALDFDDYACFGHTGHSAVIVPLLLATETGASGTDQIVAQTVANEVEARLGGACLIGPLNGQLWSFIHAAGSALAAGRLLGLGADAMAHALAIALYQAPRPTVPGFMAPDSKLLTAAEPSLIGLRAARLAAAGVTGPLDALDHPHGFFDAFAYAPLPAVLGGLGEGWATQTLCVKPYPGCAYVDTTVDALRALGDDLPDPAEIESVVVDAGILTCEMDALSRQYAVGGSPTPVTVNFSIPWNVAIALTAGRLTPDEVDDGWLAEHAAALAPLAQRVELRHDWSLTLQTAEAMAPLLPPRGIGDGTGARRLLGGVRHVRRDHAGLNPGARDAIALVRALRTGGSASRARAAATARRLWAPEALEQFAMTFPARVRVTRRDGQVIEAEAAVPRGGAGSTTLSPELASREKLAAWGPRLWGADRADAIAKAIDTDDPQLASLVGSAE